MKTRNILIGGVLLAAGTALYLRKRKTIPEGIDVVKPFDVNKYLGKWYEIARLDYHFEKGLDNVTAEYFLNGDGSVKVINTGYNYKKSEKEQSVGRAVFVGSSEEAKLKVSFWGPFYAGYNVVAIDKAYKYAMVVGRDYDYLWLLSRETTMPDNIKRSFLQKAKGLGFNTDNLVWSEHR